MHLVEYIPIETEWRIAVSIWAFGLMVRTLGLKVALPIFAGREALGRSER